MARSDRPRTPSPKALDHLAPARKGMFACGSALARGPVGRRGNFYLGQVIDDHLRQDLTIEFFVGRLFR